MKGGERALESSVSKVRGTADINVFATASSEPAEGGGLGEARLGAALGDQLPPRQALPTMSWPLGHTSTTGRSATTAWATRSGPSGLLCQGATRTASHSPRVASSADVPSRHGQHRRLSVCVCVGGSFFLNYRIGCESHQVHLPAPSETNLRAPPFKDFYRIIIKHEETATLTL